LEVKEADDLHVVVEGPTWGDARFYGEWLLTASKAQELWKEALRGSEFAEQAERVCVCYEPDFGITAAIMLMNLRGHWTSFVLDLQTEDGDDFAMMFCMGFFIRRGRICRMAVPPLLNLSKLKNAILTFVTTQDPDYILHPEYLLPSMSAASAKVLQAQINAFHGPRDKQLHSLQ
jgi:hypothetical protein